jgi:phage baseplate assembly protein W
MLPLINPSSNTTPYPIGLSIPIQRGSAGYFDQTYDTVSQTKMNIMNLLNTVRGERRFQPLFGSGLQSALFEQNLSNSPDVLKQIITDDINTWIPNVVITDIEFNLQGTDSNTLIDNYIVYIKILFTVNNVKDSINLVLQQNGI